MKFDGTSWAVSYGGKTIPRWRTAAILNIDISPYLSEKSSDFHDILYIAADFELDERHVIKNKKLHWTDSEFDRTYFLCLQSIVFNLFRFNGLCGLIWTTMFNHSFFFYAIVVKIDSKKAEDGPQVYFGLSSTVREQQKQLLQAGASGAKKPTQMSAGSLALNTDDSLQIATLVCSTKLTHNGMLSPSHISTVLV